MIDKLRTASKRTLIICSLLVGFFGGVVFTVYKSPSITSQLSGTEQTAPNQPDWPQHISHLEEGIAKDPTNTEMWSQLANAYYEAQDYPKSIETYLKLISLLDESTKPYQDLGVVYRRGGQFEKAIDAFKKAIAQDPENLQALFNIGVVQYHDLKDEDGAKKTWEKVAKVKPDFQLSTGQTLEQLLEKLK
jgi:tetratricopeptide (TPR) repeat protein